MRRNGVEHRAARISAVTGLSTFLSVGFQLISVPICLKYWGNETYGSWLALYATFMLVRSLDTGFVAYVGNKLNYLYHLDQDALQAHLASSLAGVAIIGVIQLSIGLVAASSKFLGSFLGLGDGAGSTLALLILVATWVLSGAYLGIVHRLLIPTGMMYQSAWWSMGFQASQFFAIILAAMLHFDILQTSLLFAFIQFSIYFASAVYIKRKLPHYYPWWSGFRPRVGVGDLRRSLLLAASSLLQQGTVNGAVIVVSWLSGPALVPAFTTVRTLANLWTNVTNVLTTPLLPEIVRYHALGEGRKLVSITEAYWVLVGSAVNLGVLVTYPMIKPLYGYWTAHAMVLDVPLLCLLLASVVVTNIGGLMSLYLNGINSLGIVLTAAATRAGVSLIVGALLFLHFGLVGLGAGILVSELFVLLLTGRYFAKHELSRKKARLRISSFAPIIVSSACVLLFLASEGFAFAYVQKLHLAALFGVVLAGFWGWTGLEDEVKARLVSMVSNRVSKKDVT